MQNDLKRKRVGNTPTFIPPKTNKYKNCHITITTPHSPQMHMIKVNRFSEKRLLNNSWRWTFVRSYSSAQIQNTKFAQNLQIMMKFVDTKTHNNTIIAPRSIFPRLLVVVVMMMVMQPLMIVVRANNLNKEPSIDYFLSKQLTHGMDWNGMEESPVRMIREV